MASASELLQHFRARERELVEQFFEFLRIPSISSEPEYVPEMLRCAEWLERYLSNLGLQVERWTTSVHPIVYAEFTTGDPKSETVLIYNHYDVQPVDPLALWQSPPFEPEVRNGEVYARGAVDNKGQCFFVLAALEYLMKTQGKLPCNVKLLIEGEEETSSKGLSELLRSHAERLRADHLFVVDVGFRHPEAPAVTLGVRGIVAFTLEVTASNTDVHSGVYGGIMPNPLQATTELLAKLYDNNGWVAIPGFYDSVTTPTNAELADLDFTFDEEEFTREYGALAAGTEQGISPLEAAWLRPRLEINGIGGGYFGEGFKTVIPGTVVVKLSCRLVPDQDPHQIAELVRSFLMKNAPQNVRVKVDVAPGGVALRTKSTGRGVKAASEAITEVVGKPCTNIMTGGSIPIIAELAKASQSEVVFMGFALPEDNLHAPNEHFGIDRISKGAATIVRILQKLGNVA